jgi:hypothetical protein
MRPPCLRVLRIVQRMIDFVRRTKFDLYQTRSPPFGRLMLSKGCYRGVAGEDGERNNAAHVRGCSVARGVGCAWSARIAMVVASMARTVFSRYLSDRHLPSGIEEDGKGQTGRGQRHAFVKPFLQSLRSYRKQAGEFVQA